MGTVEQYSPETREPSSPVSISLSRTAKGYNPISGELASGGNSLSVSPNPFEREVTLRYTLTREQKVRITVSSMDGAQVHSSSRYAGEGENTTVLSLDVAAGTYILSLEGENVKLNAKMVKK